MVTARKDLWNTDAAKLRGPSVVWVIKQTSRSCYSLGRGILIAGRVMRVAEALVVRRVRIAQNTGKKACHRIDDNGGPSSPPEST